MLLKLQPRSFTSCESQIFLNIFECSTSNKDGTKKRKTSIDFYLFLLETELKGTEEIA